MKRILVIRLGALGDFILSFGPFAAIRAHHPDSHITLLTTPPFAALARLSPWFDTVWAEPSPAWWQGRALYRLARGLRGFDFVYDLQTSGRSSRYYWLAGRPPWSGVARGASHPHANPDRNRLHTLDRQRDQLAMAGIPDDPFPSLDWLRTHETVADLPTTPLALLIPGAAPHRPEKRWPAESFGVLAAGLVARGITPVVAGTHNETPLAHTIQALCPQALDLTGRTSLPGLAALASRAAFAIGNDTGPMHLAAAMGARCLVLFSGASDPALTAPRGPAAGFVQVLREARLDQLEAARVLEALDRMASP